MNLLNQEILALKNTIVVKRKMMDAVKNINVKANLRLEIMVLEKILEDKLAETDCGDYL